MPYIFVPFIFANEDVDLHDLARILNVILKSHSTKQDFTLAINSIIRMKVWK